MGKVSITDISTKRLFTIQEAGFYLALSQWTIREHISNGLLPFVRIGRRILLDRIDLDDVIKSNKERIII